MTTPLMVYSRERLAQGSFDGGKIQEVKPIGFPGEKAPVLRAGTLFYWAWATAREPAFIDEHPHQSFEILTYVLAGRVEHRDDLGHASLVGPGGAQPMRTGSGVWHSERLLDPGTSLLQIWLEPPRKEAVRQAPSYAAVDPSAWPRASHGGVETLTLLGPGSPLVVAAPARLLDVRVAPGVTWRAGSRQDHEWSCLILEGAADGMPWSSFVHGGGSLSVTAPSGSSGVRLVAAETPVRPGYPLYHKARPKLAP